MEILVAFENTSLLQYLHGFYVKVFRQVEPTKVSDLGAMVEACARASYTNA
jgi:hypothetical protein